ALMFTAADANQVHDLRSRTGLFVQIQFCSGGKMEPKNIALLEAVKSTGSIAAAARQLRISYSHAWGSINQINQMLRNPAVITSLGWRGGGSAALTPVGDQIIKLFRRVEDRVQ